jgi:hypothetical protein
MSPLFGVVLAQAINLGVSDRTEARRVVSYDRHFEAETYPAIGINFGWPRFDVSLGYGASILATPLESSEREYLVNNTAVIGAAYRFKHTRLSLGSVLTFGKVNFLLQPLANPGLQPNSLPGAVPPPAQPGPTTGEPQPTQPTQPNQPNQPAQPTPAAGVPTQPPPQTDVYPVAIDYLTSTTDAQVVHNLSREITVRGFVSYYVQGSTNEEQQALYPFGRGTTIGAQGTHTWQRGYDTFNFDASLQQSWSSLGNRVTALFVSDRWRHAFDSHTATNLGVGVSMIRFAQDNGLEGYSTYPAFMAGIEDHRRLHPGTLSMQLTAYATPVLDPLRATIDPRIGLSANAGWAGKRWYTTGEVSSSFSVAQPGNDAAAFDVLSGSALIGYSLTNWMSADAGTRIARQQFQDQTTIPFSYTVFLALTFTAATKLNGR